MTPSLPAFARAALSWLIVAAVSACGSPLGSSPQTRLPTLEHEPPQSCAFEGTWSGIVRAGEVPILHARGIEVRAELEQTTLSGSIHDAGWHIRAQADVSHDLLLRAKETLWLHEGIGVHAGVSVEVQQSELGRVRVRAPSSTFSDIQRHDDLSRWLPCDQLMLAPEFEGDTQTIRDGLNLTSQGWVFLNAGETLPISVHPEGPPFLTFDRVAHSRRFERLAPLTTEMETAEDTDWVRVLQLGVSRVAIVGWVPARQLNEPQGITGYGTGSGGGLAWHDVCHSPEVLDLYAPGGSGQESVPLGQIDAGASFVRLSQEMDGSLRVAPVSANGRLDLFSPEVVLLARGAQTVECERMPASPTPVSPVSPVAAAARNGQGTTATRADPPGDLPVDPTLPLNVREPDHNEPPSDEEVSTCRCGDENEDPMGPTIEDLRTRPPQTRPSLPRGRLHLAERSHGTLSEPDRRTINLGVRRRRSSFLRCYERRLQHTPALQGRLSVTFTVANGRVETAHPHNDTTHDDELQHCIVQTFRRLRFVLETTQRSSDVSYEFFMRPRTE